MSQNNNDLSLEEWRREKWDNTPWRRAYIEQRLKEIDTQRQFWEQSLRELQRLCKHEDVDVWNKCRICGDLVF